MTLERCTRAPGAAVRPGTPSPRPPAHPTGLPAAAVALAALLAPGGADAADLRVGPSEAYTDLDDALAAASSGDRILVTPGTYTGDYRVTRKVEIVGVGRGRAILQGAGGTVLELTSGASGSVVRRLTVQGGNGRQGGGISASGGSFHFEKVVVKDSYASSSGGGLYCGSADCTVVDSTFKKNAADGDGGGLAASGGTLTVERSRFLANTTLGRGGGLFAHQSTVLVDDSDLADNVNDGVAPYGGGGGASFNSCPWVSFTRNLVQGNLASVMGGGVGMLASSGELIGNLVQDNEATLDMGGLGLQAGDYEAIGNVVRWNRCGVAGGGIDFLYTTGGVLRNNVVYGNEAGQTAGGILIEDGIADVYNNVVAYNTSVHGGGGILLGRGSIGEVAWNTVYANDSGGMTMDGIGSIEGSDTRFRNNVSVFNVDSGFGAEASRTVDVAWNDGYGNGTGVFDYAGDADLEGVSGNLSVDPLLGLAGTGDVADDDPRPASGSPVVDAGDPSFTDPDGTRCDMGAFGGPHGAAWSDLPVDFGW